MESMSWQYVKHNVNVLHFVCWKFRKHLELVHNIPQGKVTWNKWKRKSAVAPGFLFWYLWCISLTEIILLSKLRLGHIFVRFCGCLELALESKPSVGAFTNIHTSKRLTEAGVRQASVCFSLSYGPLLRNRSVIFGPNLTDCRLILWLNTVLCSGII